MNIHGVIVPLLTPVNQDESVNEEYLKRLVDYTIDGGVNAIFAMGTTGEFARFDANTRERIIGLVAKYVAGRVPVYAGVSDCGTRLVKEHIRRAEQAGAQAVAVTLPYYFPNTSEYEVCTFFEEVAASTSLPVILYNIPVAVGREIPFSVIDRLFEIDNICAVKDSSGDMAYLKELLSRYHGKSKKFSVVVGNESMNYAGLRAGADGMIPSLANPYPKLLAAVYTSAVEKDWEKLKYYCDIVDEMNQLNTFSDSWMSPNIWRKVALEQMGITNSCFTAPYNPVDPQTARKISETINRYHQMFGNEES